MSVLLLNILVGAVVSFAGSLPVGILNLTAMRTGWSRGMRAVFYFALACALVEAVYSTIAVVAAKVFIHTDGQRTVSQLVSVVVLLVGGIYYWRKCAAAEQASPVLNVFAKGIMLSVVNVVAIPFWLVYTSALQAYRWISVDGIIAVACYVAGISVGTGLALLVFGTIGKQVGRRFDLDTRLINKGIGLILFASGLVEIVSIVY